MKSIIELITLESNYKKEKSEIASKEQKKRAQLEEEYQRKMDIIAKELSSKEKIISEKVKEQLSAQPTVTSKTAEKSHISVSSKQIEDCIINALH